MVVGGLAVSPGAGGDGLLHTGQQGLHALLGRRSRGRIGRDIWSRRGAGATHTPCENSPAAWFDSYSLLVRLRVTWGEAAGAAISVGAGKDTQAGGGSRAGAKLGEGTGAGVGRAAEDTHLNVSVRVLAECSIGIHALDPIARPPLVTLALEMLAMLADLVDTVTPCLPYDSPPWTGTGRRR